MRTVINEQPVYWQSASSGVAASTVEEVTLTAAQGATSDIIQVSLNFPTDFDDDSHTDGIYNPRIWFENMPQQKNVDWEWEMQGALVDKTGTLSAGSAIPKVYQYNPATQDGAIDKTTYWDAVNQRLAYINFQIDATSATITYDTDEQARSNPLLVCEWDRMDQSLLDTDFLSPESDHLWDFSECDLYLDDTIVIDGTTYTNRFKLGWIADENLELNLSEESVEFVKGKPTAKAVTFTSSFANEINAQIATMDPKLFEYLLNIAPQDTQGYYKYTQTNKQKNRRTFAISMEWQLNSGYRVRMKFPKAQMYITGAFSPGGSEIVNIPFMITPLVNPNTRNIYTLEISKSPLQRAVLPINYSITT